MAATANDLIKHKNNYNSASLTDNEHMLGVVVAERPLQHML